jgi:hypothetical protein
VDDASVLVAAARAGAEQALVELAGGGDLAAGVAELDARMADPHGVAVKPGLLELSIALWRRCPQRNGFRMYGSVRIVVVEVEICN